MYILHSVYHTHAYIYTYVYTRIYVYILCAYSIHTLSNNKRILSKVLLLICPKEKIHERLILTRLRAQTCASETLIKGTPGVNKPRQSAVSSSWTPQLTAVVCSRGPAGNSLKKILQITKRKQKQQRPDGIKITATCDDFYFGNSKTFRQWWFCRVQLPVGCLVLTHGLCNWSWSPCFGQQPCWDRSSCCRVCCCCKGSKAAV